MSTDPIYLAPPYASPASRERSRRPRRRAEGPGRRVERAAVGPPSGTAGEVGYQGSVDFGASVDWSIGYDAAALLQLPIGPAVDVLAALGHPTRIALVRALVPRAATATEPAATVELSSPGQLYHHLRTLTTAGVVTASGGGSYRIAPAILVPVLVLILAAADVAERLPGVRAEGVRAEGVRAVGVRAVGVRKLAT